MTTKTQGFEGLALAVALQGAANFNAAAEAAREARAKLEADPYRLSNVLREAADDSARLRRQAVGDRNEWTRTVREGTYGAPYLIEYTPARSSGYEARGKGIVELAHYTVRHTNPALGALNDAKDFEALTLEAAEARADLYNRTNNKVRASVQEATRRKQRGYGRILEGYNVLDELGRRVLTVEGATEKQFAAAKLAAQAVTNAANLVSRSR